MAATACPATVTQKTWCCRGSSLSAEEVSNGLMTDADDAASQLTELACLDDRRCLIRLHDALLPTHIPLQLSIQGFPGHAELALDSVVGGMRTRLTLFSPEEIPSSISALQQEATVYSEGFRHVHAETYLRETSDRDRLDASHRFASESMPNTTDIEAAFSPAISVVDLLVTMGQVTQAAIYRRVDESARRGELWLRSMTIDLDNSPRALPCALRSRTRVVRDQLLVRGERRTHSLRTESTIEEAARIRADLAYVEPGFTSNQGAEV